MEEKDVYTTVPEIIKQVKTFIEQMYDRVK